MAILNVEPGAYCPTVAVLMPAPPGPLAAASTEPVEACSITMALADGTSASRSSAYSCNAESRVSAKSVPRTGADSLSTTSPDVPVIITVVAGAPRNCAS